MSDNDVKIEKTLFLLSQHATKRTNSYHSKDAAESKRSLFIN